MRSGKKEQLVKSKHRKDKFGEVYTPEWLVKDMCDLLPFDAFDSIDRTFLEPACGNGNFLVEILSRKLELCKDVTDCMTALNSIYGIDILPDNVEEAKKRMLDIVQAEFGFFVYSEAKKILDQRIICGDSLKIMKELQTKDLEEL